jgi:predicted nucleic acid-binding Zn ribbon protein
LATEVAVANFGKGMRKAGDIVKEIFAKNFGANFFEEASGTANLFSAWAGIVQEVWAQHYANDDNFEEPAVAFHSRISELKHGALIVEADHPACIQLLKTKSRELLAAVKRRYPEQEIRALAFRLES